jgi:hypothetical protein
MLHHFLLHIQFVGINKIVVAAGPRENNYTKFRDSKSSEIYLGCIIQRDLSGAFVPVAAHKCRKLPNLPEHHTL